MKKNMGTIDKSLRMMLSIVVAVLYFSEVISGTTALILGALAIIFILTSFISFCPLYVPFGINSCKKEK
ncbi:MAG: YgaP family membrane protein [Flavobacterium sp.]